ncbi:uncharacterized, partial [Tachysurus ichikawai]
MRSRRGQTVHAHHVKTRSDRSHPPGQDEVRQATPTRSRRGRTGHTHEVKTRRTMSRRGQTGHTYKVKMRSDRPHPPGQDKVGQATPMRSRRGHTGHAHHVKT